MLWFVYCEDLILKTVAPHYRSLFPRVKFFWCTDLRYGGVVYLPTCLWEQFAFDDFSASACWYRSHRILTIALMLPIPVLVLAIPEQRLMVQQCFPVQFVQAQGSVLADLLLVTPLVNTSAHQDSDPSFTHKRHEAVGLTCLPNSVLCCAEL